MIHAADQACAAWPNASRPACGWSTVDRVQCVYPDGKRGIIPDSVNLGDVLVGDDGREYTVEYVDHVFATNTTVAYLDHAGERVPQKLVHLVMRGTRYPLTLPEAAQLRRRVRVSGDQHPATPATGAAVVLDQLVEDEPGSTPPIDLRPSEYAAIALAIENWLLEGGVDSVPERVMDIRYALHRELHS